MEEPLVLPLLLHVIPAKAGIQLLLAQTECAANKSAIRRTARRANPAQQPMDGLRPCSQPWMARRGSGIGWACSAPSVRRGGVGEQLHDAMQRCTQTLSRNPQVA